MLTKARTDCFWQDHEMAIMGGFLGKADQQVISVSFFFSVKCKAKQTAALKTAQSERSEIDILQGYYAL